MKTILKMPFTFIPIFFVSLQLSFAQAPTIQWQKALGGSGDDRARAIQQTADGGYITVGYSKSNNGNITVHHGDLIYADMWIVKLTASGNLQWQKSYGGTNEDQAMDVKQTTDKGYIIGGYTYSNDGDVTSNHGSADVWILKIDSVGRILWQKTYGGSDVDIAEAIQQTNDGGYIVAGTTVSTNGDVTRNHGGGDFWILKLNATGDLIWQKTYGGLFSDEAHSIQQTTDGGYIVAGETNSNNGDVKTNLGGVDYWVLKLNAKGNINWENTYGGSNNDIAHSVKQTADGGFIVAGETFSNNDDVTGLHGNQPDYWVIKLDARGHLQWQKTLGGTQADRAFGVSVAQNGSYLVAGVAFSNDGDITGNQGNYEDWVVNLSSAGKIIWQLALGGSGADGSYDIQQATDGGYFITGFTGSNDGDVTGNHGGLADFWVVKLNKTSAAMSISKSNILPKNNISFKVFQKQGLQALSVRLSLNDSRENGMVLLQVMNTGGQVVTSKKSMLINRFCHDEITLNYHSAHGIYYVTATVDNDIFRQSILLQ